MKLKGTFIASLLGTFFNLLTFFRNFVLEHYKGEELKETKKITFEAFYELFKYLTEDYERKMTLNYAKSLKLIGELENSKLGYMRTRGNTRIFNLIGDKENKIVIKMPQLKIDLNENGEKIPAHNSIITGYDICYLCENGVEPLVKFKVAEVFKKLKEEREKKKLEEDIEKHKEEQSTQNTMVTEKTFIMVKPDGVKRRIIGETIKKFEKRGLRLIDLKLCKPDESKFHEHYEEHVGKPFFQGLVEYMMMGPVVQMVFEGPHAVQISRMMIGKTRPNESDAGTIRGDFAIEMRRNVIHGSDSNDSAEREIEVWFADSDVLQKHQLDKKESIKSLISSMSIQIHTVGFNRVKPEEKEESEFSSDMSRINSAVKA